MTDTARWPYGQGQLTRRLDGTALDGTALAGTALDGTALAGTALDGTALDGTAPPAVQPSRRIRAVPTGPVAPGQELAA